MTEQEFKEFIVKLDALFPGKLNRDQVQIWQSRLLKIPFGEALSALNDYYSMPKLPGDGPQPALSGFLRHARSKKVSRPHQRKEELREDSRPSGEDWILETMRAVWVVEARQNREYEKESRILSASTDDLRFWYRKDEYMKALMYYPVDSGFVLDRWGKYREASIKLGTDIGEINIEEQEELKKALQPLPRLSFH